MGVGAVVSGATAVVLEVVTIGDAGGGGVVGEVAGFGGVGAGAGEELGTDGDFFGVVKVGTCEAALADTWENVM